MSRSQHSAATLHEFASSCMDDAEWYRRHAKHARDRLEAERDRLTADKLEAMGKG